MERLTNYRALLARVDKLAAGIREEFGSQLACRAGCDGCCRHLSLLVVEGVALSAALHELPGGLAEHIRQRARNAAADDPCPLLEDGLCLLYAARPIICRSHGLPLLIVTDGTRRVDFCPLNFQGIETLPGGAVIYLEQLNSALAAINALFVREAGVELLPGEERLTIAEALLLDVGKSSPPGFHP
jgi:uncharacterized protein